VLSYVEEVASHSFDGILDASGLSLLRRFRG
jgi:hypothetical protein